MLAHFSVGTRLIWLPINTELQVYAIFWVPYQPHIASFEFNDNISILVQMMVIIINTPV